MAVPAFTEIYYFFRPSQSDTYTVVSFHRIQLYHLPKKEILDQEREKSMERCYVDYFNTKKTTVGEGRRKLFTFLFP